MALLQLARGLWTKFAKTENPFEAINGMEENLRLIDDHLGLYTVLPPQAPGTPFPANPANGDGQIYTDGSYAVYNGASWNNYFPRRGVSALEPDGTRWGNTGTGWAKNTLEARLAAAEGAGIVGFQQLGTGAVPRTMLSKAREKVSVRDFMASEAMIADSFLAAPVMDHSEAVQNFFNYLATSAVGFADCSGNFRITRPIVINGLKTLTVNCGVKFICDFATEDAAILITNSWYAHFTGQIEVACKGSTGFASRTIGTGLRVTDDSRINLDYVVVRFAKYYGMVVDGVSSQASIDYLSCNYCGTGFGSAALEYKRNVVASSKKDAAQNGSRNQRSLLTLDGGMGVIDKTRFIYVLNEFYLVTAVDKATSTIEVFPWLDSAVVAGSEVGFVVGAGYYSVSGDTSVINIGTLDALVCGVGYHCESLYPGLIGTFVSQSCGIGAVIGSGTSSAAVGGSMSVAYFEANKLDILIPTSAQLSYKIQSTTAWTPERNIRLSPRFNDNSINLGQRQFTGIEIGFNGKTISAPNNSTINYSGVIVTPEPSPSSFSFSKLDNQGIYLTPSRAFDIYQHQDVYVMTVGNATHGGPSGAVTFVPSSGYTINGGAAGVNAVYTGLTGPTLWHAYLDGTGKNWRVSKCTFSP